MAEVTQSQFDLAFIRRSQEDHKLILNALAADGTLTVVADVVEPALDEEGNEILVSPSAAVEIAVENTGEDEEE